MKHYSLQILLGIVWLVLEQGTNVFGLARFIWLFSAVGFIIFSIINFIEECKQ